MKKLFLIVCVLLAASSASFSQQNMPLIATEQSSALPAMAATTQPISDSLRQAVHRLFKWSRLYGTIGAVSGGLMVAGAIGYIARDDDDWSTGVNLALGANALTMGSISMVRFSRRRERELMKALEQGQPMPPYVTYWMPLIPSKSKKKQRLN
ncbi:hypothetical protein ACW9KT_18155 [Hymenobacter sp. HD11105]